MPEPRRNEVIAGALMLALTAGVILTYLLAGSP
jgi:hypothetical protein